MLLIITDFMSTSLHHQLVIEVGKDFFAFGLKDLPTDKFTRFQSCNLDSLAPLDAQLDQIFSENNWLLATYRDILVIHNNDLNTFVPQILFDETLMGNYLQYTVKIYSTDFFDFDECHDMRNVYVPYVNFNNYLIDKLGTFSYRHISTVFLDYVLDNQTDIKDGVFVCINQKSLLICVVQNGKFKLYNRFSVQSKEDFAYYTLFVYEQLNLDRLEIPLLLMGDITNDDDYYQLISEFIQKPSVLPLQKEVDTVSDVVRSHFLTLQV